MPIAPYPTIAASAETALDGAALGAALFLLLLVLIVMGGFVWAGYRLRQREKQPPPAYAEFLDVHPAEEVDAELDESGR